MLLQIHSFIHSRPRWLWCVWNEPWVWAKMNIICSISLRFFKCKIYISHTHIQKYIHIMYIYFFLCQSYITTFYYHLFFLSQFLPFYSIIDLVLKCEKYFPTSTFSYWLAHGKGFQSSLSLFSFFSLQDRIQTVESKFCKKN